MSWISVDDKVPETSDDVLCLVYIEEYGIENHCFVGFYEDKGWFHSYNMTNDFSKTPIQVSHWMPLPKLPEHASN